MPKCEMCLEFLNDLSAYESSQVNIVHTLHVYSPCIM